MWKFKSEEEICNGCYCKITQIKMKVCLTTVCHGRPDIIISGDKSQLLCPCSKCLVKMVCQNSCDQYRFYVDVARERVSIKIYQDTY